MEITIVSAALLLGFTTGFHCLGMCGPIALSLGLVKRQKANFYLQNLVYQLGRISTYVFLGLILGLVGEGFEMAGFQRYLTFSVGILMLITAFFSFKKGGFMYNIPIININKLLLRIKFNIGKFLSRTDYSSRYFTGIFNGFLPCGMVYIALTASIAAGGLWQGAIFMALFGLGTVPFMFSAVLFGNLLSVKTRNKVLKFVPVIMFGLGILFIIRSMELGIPYLSPKSEVMTIHSEDTSCCH